MKKPRNGRLQVEPDAGYREKILDAAVQIIATAPLDKLTHREIARIAGVPLASTTYYFKTKSDLVAAAYLYNVQQLRERSMKHARMLRDGAALRSAFTGYFQAALGADRGRLKANLQLALATLRDPSLLEVSAWIQETEVAQIKQYAPSGFDPEQWAHMLMAAVTGQLLLSLADGQS